MTSQGPVLVVLPPRTAGRDERESLLAQGLLEDVCGALTRFAALQVISWTSGAAVAHLSDPAIGERLGATHILRSRLESSGGRLRVKATLVESTGGAQVWSESLEAAADDPFSIQDELVGRIAATLTARLEQAALNEARRKAPEALAAYELTLRGLAALRRGTLRADEEARGLFQRALEIDPHHARAMGGMSLSYFNEWSCQFWDRFQDNGRLAYQHAHRALELDDSDAMLHVVIGRIHLYHRRFEQASWYFDRALALCPNDADNLIQLSNCQVFLGHPETGKEMAGRAMRLNPYHPNSWYAYAALPWFVDREFEKALETGFKSGIAPVVDIPAYTAIALAYLGRLDEARQHLADYHRAFRELITFGREPEPGESVRWLLEVNPYRREADVAMIMEGFRLLGESGAASAGGGDAAGAARNPPPERATLARQGAGWVAEFMGRSAVLPDLKGIHDIRRLLEQPGEDIHCLDLAGRGAELAEGDAVLDHRARHDLGARIRELQEELSDAENMQDIGRTERAREELDRLVETLSNALDLRGRPRRLGSLAERARSTVTWRIRHALRRIQPLHQPLAGHLANSIRTGTFCAYRPERTMSWRFSEDGSRASRGGP